jgi:hypothetical protein
LTTWVETDLTVGKIRRAEPLKADEQQSPLIDLQALGKQASDQGRADWRPGYFRVLRTRAGPAEGFLRCRHSASTLVPPVTPGLVGPSSSRLDSGRPGFPYTSQQWDSAGNRRVSNWYCIWQPTRAISYPSWYAMLAASTFGEDRMSVWLFAAGRDPSPPHRSPKATWGKKFDLEAGAEWLPRRTISVKVGIAALSQQARITPRRQPVLFRHQLWNYSKCSDNR